MELRQLASACASYVRVSSTRQQDLGYFDSIDRAIRDPAIIGAMVHDLLALDLATYRVQQRPKSRELARQKLLSLAGFDRYWYEVLGSGHIDRRGGLQGVLGEPLEEEWVEARFVPSEDLLAGWRDHDRNGVRFESPQINDIPAKVLRVCPSAVTGARHMVRGRQHRGVELPPIAVARKEFEVMSVGGVIDWERARSIEDEPPCAHELALSHAEAASIAHAVFAKIMTGIGTTPPPSPEGAVEG